MEYCWAAQYAQCFNGDCGGLHAGVKIEDACHALGSFINAKRRLEVKGEVNGDYGL